MEDKLKKKKTEQMEETQNNAIANALSSIYRSALNEEDLQTQREDSTYYRKLARPRSVKYLELLSKEMQIAERLAELYELLDKCGRTASAGERPKPPIGDGQVQEGKAQQAAMPEWWQADVKPLQADYDIPEDGNSGIDWLKSDGDDERTEDKTEEVQIEELQQTTEEQPQTQEWWQADVQKVQQEETFDNSAILEEIAQLKAELEEVRKAVEAEMPVGHGRLGMIYRSDKEGKLIGLGAIPGPGIPFHSPEELLEQRQPQTEQEKQQWLKGNDVYMEVRGECLVVEIYLTAICVVFDDGSVKCYRD